MPSDAERRLVYDAFRSQLGPEPADLMMRLVSPLDRDELARREDLLALQSQIIAIQGDLASVKGDIAEFKVELKIDMAEFKAEVKEDIAAFKSEVRSDIADLRTHVDAQVTRTVLAMVPLMIGQAGVILAAAKLT